MKYRGVAECCCTLVSEWRTRIVRLVVLHGSTFTWSTRSTRWKRAIDLLVSLVSLSSYYWPFGMILVRSPCDGSTTTSDPLSDNKQFTINKQTVSRHPFHSIQSRFGPGTVTNETIERSESRKIKILGHSINLWPIMGSSIVRPVKDNWQDGTTGMWHWDDIWDFWWIDMR